MERVGTVQTVQQSGGGTQQTENSSSSTPFFVFILQQQPESVEMNEIWQWSLKTPTLFESAFNADSDSVGFLKTTSHMIPLRRLQRLSAQAEREELCTQRA